MNIQNFMGEILKAWKPISSLLLAGVLLIPAGMASADNNSGSGSSDQSSITTQLNSGEVLLMTPEEMKAEGIGGALDRQKQEESLSLLTAEQRNSQTEIRNGLNEDMAAAGVTRGDAGDLVSIENVPLEETISSRIWSPDCWTSGNYYEVNVVRYSGKHCFANAGSKSFNSGFAFDNDIVSLRPGNNRGYVTYFHNGNYFNSITRGPDYATYSFVRDGGTGFNFYGITIF